MKLKRIVALGAVLALLMGMSVTTAKAPESMASTTVDNLRQVGASILATKDDKGVETLSYTVTLAWNGTDTTYDLYQDTGDKLEKLQTITPEVTEENEKQFTISGLSAGHAHTFVLKAAGSSDSGVKIDNVRTLPQKVSTPRLSYWFRNSDAVDFLWTSDLYADGYQVRVLDAKGKVLYENAFARNATADNKNEIVTIKPSYRGRVAKVVVRGFITIDGIHYVAPDDRDWSEPCYYAAPKKVKISGYKDAIKISGLSVSGATKKAIYVSTKKDKGYKKAKQIGAKSTKAKVTKFGNKLIRSNKNYYVRIYYYYKVDGKEYKSPVVDGGKVYVKPTYFYVK